MTTVPTAEPGSARAFPAGRLSDFEDAGDSGAQDPRYLAGLLPPRSVRPRPAAVPVAEPVTQAPAPETESADEVVGEQQAEDLDTQPAGTDSSEAAAVETADVEPTAAEIPELEAVGGPRTAPASADMDRLGDNIRTTRPPRKRTPRREAGVQSSAGVAETPDPVAPLIAELDNDDLESEESGVADKRLRASNVHIPASFMPRLAKAREDRKLSNGEWVIAALEATYDQLDSLIRPQPTGGSLFAPRATRAARVYDGPLTPYNVRLREADYAVIDELVEKFGASSRGHLITVAFDSFLPTT